MGSHLSAVTTRESAVVVVKASTTRGQADQIATRAQVHDLVVVDDAGTVVGTICRCYLAEPGSPAGLLPVAEFMDRVCRP